MLVSVANRTALAYSLGDSVMCVVLSHSELVLSMKLFKWRNRVLAALSVVVVPGRWAHRTNHCKDVGIWHETYCDSARPYLHVVTRVVRKPTAGSEAPLVLIYGDLSR